MKLLTLQLFLTPFTSCLWQPDIPLQNLFQLWVAESVSENSAAFIFHNDLAESPEEILLTIPGLR
jgi:hypothetical protein